jgi:hypothetical protein
MLSEVRAARLGLSFRARREAAMTNEVLAKLLCHNSVVNIQELGIVPVFWEDEPLENPDVLRLVPRITLESEDRMTPFSQTLLAYGPIDDPVYIWSLMLLAGFALLYSKDIATRLGGMALCAASSLMLLVVWPFSIALAIVFVVFRPGWLRGWFRIQPQESHQDQLMQNPS